MRKRIVQRDGVPVVAIPPKLLDELGLSLGDEVELQVIDGLLMVMPVAGVLSTESGFDAVMEDLLNRRSDIYAVLGD
ncbi:MAG: hypothetical protein KDE53_01015 [Caldilineaceae bacterium]|nr:hypothetical protein [Caldilineaceae bacterium]MCB0185621.1 hypothetical protein [Caldilineaceae bacterium]